MARIERHPAVENYIVEMTLQEIGARGGVADIFEEGRIILIKDYRLPVDTAALASLAKTTDTVENPMIRRQLKKLQSPHFFAGAQPQSDKGRLVFPDELRQSIYDVLCRGDNDLYRRAAAALKSAHDEVNRVFELCFPGYEPFRFIPSVRLTRTLFENLHWDNHSIDDDFHQARIFANLDTRPRIWQVSHRFPDIVRLLYAEHGLAQFAGKDPNLMVNYINGDVLGGTTKTWMEHLPKHRVAFDPGEVWLGESRLISHQIFYGEAAMVYMWFVRAASMSDPNNRFNIRIEQLHAEMAAQAADAA